MSLTGHLGRRGDPIREFFEARFPILKGVHARWRDYEPSQLAPRPDGGNLGAIGSAFDYRLRYLFDASVGPTQFVAYQGAAELA